LKMPGTRCPASLRAVLARFQSPIIGFLEIRDSRLTCRCARVPSRVGSARAGELIPHNDCEVANEQSRGRGQLSNNNKIHNQFLYVFQARAVYVSPFAPR
jgi:hypothetical protein